MGNCLKTKLKEVVNNDNLDFLGMTKIHVCNNQNDVKGINAFKGTTKANLFPVGSRIVGEGTFSSGKKIVEDGDEAFIPANTSFDVYVPKYTHFINGVGLPSDNGESALSSAAIDIDDFYAFSLGNVTSIYSEYGLSFSGTNDGYKSKGNLENIIPYLRDNVYALSLRNSNIFLDLNTTTLVNKLAPLIKVIFINDKNVTGSLETFIRRFAQAKKTDILSTTGSGRIAIHNSGITSEYFNVNLDNSVVPQFNSSNIITLTQSGKTVTYNIDTDTFTEQQ